MVNQAIFREYDIRGIVGRDLTPGVARILGRAYATHLGRFDVGEVVIGRDNRDSSPALAQAFSQGVMASGADVIDVGTVVTPMLYFACQELAAGGGVMVTGSHNPADYNGFKLVRQGATIHGQEIRGLYDMIQEPAFRQGQGRYREENVTDQYFHAIVQRIRLGARPLRVVVDAGNGTAGAFAPPLLEQLGVQVVPLYCESDPTFPHHHPDPVKPSNLKDLIAKVREVKADVGLAYDGDADRIGVVDDQGHIIPGDILMAIFWREILPQHPDAPCIVEVKCSQALVDEIIRLGGTPIFYRTGHSLIKAKMKELGACFTGEMSGHMFFADEYFGYDDALYASARLLRLLSESQETLSEMAATMPKYDSTPEIRVDCADEDKFDVVMRLAREFKQSHRTIDVDGVRVLFPHGWGLVRASNTQPALVVRCEADSSRHLEEIKEEMARALSSQEAVGALDWEG